MHNDYHRQHISQGSGSSNLSLQQLGPTSCSGDPASSAPTAQHCSPVPAADVCRTAAALNAADRSTATATAEQHPDPELDIRPAGRRTSVIFSNRRRQSATEWVTNLSESPTSLAINLSPSSAAPQLVSRTQTTNTSGSGITQQAMLLGNTTPTLTASQAQMYLRAQMLIFTPTATVATVQPDIPVASSSSSVSAPTQVHNLAVRSQQLGVLPAPSPQTVPLKGTCQTQPLSMSHVKTAGQGGSSKTNVLEPGPENSKKGENLTPSTSESRVSTVTRLQIPASAQQLIAPAPYTPMQHQLMKQQLPHQQTMPKLLIQHRPQLQPLAPEPCPPPHHLPPPHPHCISTQAHSQPLSQPSPHPHPQSQQQTVVVSPVLPRSPPRSPLPPPSIIVQPQSLTPTQPAPGPAHRSPVAQIGPLRQARPAAPPSLNVPAQPLQSVRALALGPDIVSSIQVLPQTVLHAREQLPAAQALIQMPFQAMPPPQTIAVNLQVHASPPVDVPLVCSVEDNCDQEMREEHEECFVARRGVSPLTSHSESSTSTAEGETQTTGDVCQEGRETTVVTSASASVIRSSADTLLLTSASAPAALLIKSKPSGAAHSTGSLPGADSKPPQAIVKPQILTHVIEGFVIQEGLEPFPVSRSSLLTEQPVKQKVPNDAPVSPTASAPPSAGGEMQGNTSKPLEESLDSDVDELTGEEGMEGSDPDMLKCEFCGKMDYAHKFRRSKRFCSMSCAKRYNVGCSKRMGLFKSDKSSRWNRKSVPHAFGRRGRRCSILEGASGDHFMRQVPVSFPPAEEALPSASNPPLAEEAVSVAMTTRRRQNERERELRELRMRENSECSDVLQADPTLWTVDHVWEFIHSLPGCKDIAEEFRSQEIDGQALLLLKEDHLMSAMNIKLGPALKICARINMLKES
ncbi:polyhomeotic-like protein 3 isoform X3 [Rhinoraja longicauda]